MGWLTGWSYRRPVTITNTQANDLTDYQVLVTVDTASLIAAGKMKDDGGDIRFTDSDGTTLLPYWVEGPINASNTKIWVKVPQIPANGTKTIYLYYGNPTAQSESNLSATMLRVINGVVLALPLDEGTGTTVYDKSGNNNHGTIFGAQWTTDAKFGTALSFDGVDDYVRIPNNASLGIRGPISIVYWLKFPPHTIRRYEAHITKGDNSWRTSFVETTTKLHFGISGTSIDYLDGVTSLNANQWYFASFVYDPAVSVARIYYNAILDKQVTTSGLINVSTYDVAIGENLQVRNRFYTGIFDEIRVYNIALTLSDITDLYNHYPFEVPTNSEAVGKTLIRKRIDPEPTTTVGSEEVGLVIIRQRRMLIMSI
jgi:hypothetical protein